MRKSDPLAANLNVGGSFRLPQMGNFRPPLTLSHSRHISIRLLNYLSELSEIVYYVDHLIRPRGVGGCGSS